MIVVSVGTNEARFDRLLEWVSNARVVEELVIQHGPSAIRPEGASCFAYMPYDTLVGLVRRSRVFVTHAGVGSILVSLGAGRKPVVVPRLKQFGEAVDDHQLALAHRMDAACLVTVADSVERLRDAIMDADHTVTASGGASALARDLREYLLECTARADNRQGRA
jgi:UDP-N-acetylglucosamine transferase subunit ALG13